MKTVELLAPAGDKESLIAAVQNGANAVYLGGNQFSARASAKNFDYDEITWAVQYAHLREVKIYVTVNTLYKDEEFDELLSYIDFLYRIQVDALIIQDIGLCYIVRRLYPDFDIHMSTQASVFNHHGVLFFQELGVKRVVLARENTIEEIKSICQNTSIDIEIFVHGAICISYSGQCLMSSMIGKRSGNRGECAQPCRLTYQLLCDGQPLNHNIPYLLSPKDLMSVDHIDQIIESGVHSLKIEGRMKRPEYVASVVKTYRKAIDLYYKKKNISLDEDIYKMKMMFNRDYTHGYLFHDKKIVEGDYPGHKGLVVGQVLSYNKKKKRVLIHVNNSIKQGDSILFENIDKGRPINKMYSRNQLISHAKKGDKVEIEFDYPVSSGNVRKTIDINILNSIHETYVKENIKLPIKMLFSGHCNQPAILQVQYKDFVIEKKSQIIFEKSKNTSLNKERIQQQLSKLGNTVFYLKNINIDIDDNIILPISALNQLRRDAIEELNQLIMNYEIHHNKVNDIPIFQTNSATKHDIHVIAHNIDQLEVVLQYPVSYIYYPYQSNAFHAYELCCKHNKRMVLMIPRIAKDQDIQEIINSQIYQKIEYILVNDYGSYHAFSDKKRILGTGMNLYNSYHQSLFQNNLKILSLEVSYQQLKKLRVDYGKYIYQIYGKVENMVSEYCPISQYYYHEQKKNCYQCQKHNYSLLDRKGKQFDLMMDEKCHMHLLNAHTLYIDDVNSIFTQGLLLHFTNESIDEVEIVLNDFLECLFQQKKSRLIQNRHYTLGYYKN